jgi:hypothetical protein
MRIELPGLRLEYFPLGALVAYGLLRLLEERGIRARLGFADPFGRPEAFLEVEGDLDKAGLVSLLARFVEEVNPTERYGLASDQDPTPEGVRAALREGSPASPFLVAYVNPWWSSEKRPQKEQSQKKQPQKKQSQKKKPLRSPLDTSSAKQRFSAFLHEAVSALKKRRVRRKGREAAFRRVLFVEPLLPPDPLLAEEDPHHPLFGDISAPKWHVSQRRATADQASVAGGEKRSYTRRLSPAATLLAWEAFPFYPFPPGKSSLPLGFRLVGEVHWLLLPVPKEPVSASLLQALVALGPEASRRVPDLALWASPLHKGGEKEYSFFKEARRWDEVAEELGVGA